MIELRRPNTERIIRGPQREAPDDPDSIPGPGVTFEKKEDQD